MRYGPRRTIRNALGDIERRALLDGPAGGSPFHTEEARRAAWQADRARLMDEPARDGRPDAWWRYESGAPPELAEYRGGYPPCPPFGSLDMPPDADQAMVALIVTRRRRKAQHEGRIAWLTRDKKENTHVD